MTNLVPVSTIAAAVKRDRTTVVRACQRGKLVGAVLTPSPRGPVWMVPERYADQEEYALAVGRQGWKPGGKG